MVSNLANDVFFHSAVINPKNKRLSVLNCIITSWPILPASIRDLHEEQASCFPVGKMSVCKGRIKEFPKANSNVKRNFKLLSENTLFSGADFPCEGFQISLNVT